MEKLEDEGWDLDVPSADLPKLRFMTRGRVFFIIGSFTFFVASIINFVAFAFAPAAILAPLEAIQVCCQLFMGRFIHKTPITALATGATVLTCAGVVGAVVAVPPTVQSLTMPGLVALWADTTWVVYLTIVLTFAAIMQTIHVSYRRKEEEAKRTGGPMPWKNHAVTPVTYASAAAIIGALSVSQAKALSEIVTLLFPPCIINVFSEPFFYMTLFMLAATGGIWLNRSIAALGLYNPNFIIPLLQSNYILFATISGGVFFQEFAPMSAEPWRWPVFATGISVMLLGLYGLFVAGMRARKAQEDKEGKLMQRRAETKEAINAGLASIDEAGATAEGGEDTFDDSYTTNYRPDRTPSGATAAEGAGGAPETPGGGLTLPRAGSGASGGVAPLSTPEGGSKGGRVSFAVGTSPGGTTTPMHPASFALGRERASSRSRLNYMSALPEVEKTQIVGGSYAEIMHQRRVSRKIVNDSAGVDASAFQANMFSRPSVTPRRSRAASKRDSWGDSSGSKGGNDPSSESGGGIALSAAAASVPASGPKLGGEQPSSPNRLMDRRGSAGVIAALADLRSPTLTLPSTATAPLESIASRADAEAAAAAEATATDDAPVEAEEVAVEVRG
jgi:hypothetical protein